MTPQEAIKEVRKEQAKLYDPEIYGWCECDSDKLNELQNKKAQAFFQLYPNACVGAINGYNGGIPKLVRYDGEKLLNFSYAFMVPDYDEKLENLIEIYNKPVKGGFSTKKVMPKIDAIFDRIEQLRGILFQWS